MKGVDLSLAFVTGHPRAMALLDAEGRVVVHSRGWIRQEGPLPDLVGTPVPRGDHLLAALERSSHPDAAEVDRMVRQVLAGARPGAQAEIRARCSADEERSVAVVTALRLEGRPAVCLEFLPTTPSRAAATSEEETPFREVVETLESVVFVTSPGGGAGRIVHYVSPAYETVWGRPRSLLRAEPRSFLDSIHPADREGVAENLWREAQGSWDREFRIVRPDGAVRWIHSRAFPVRNARGDVDRVVTLATDVTPRREVAEALQRSRDELDRLVDQAPVALILHQRGRVLKANRVAAAYLGEDHPASVTRVDLMDRLHPDDRGLADPPEGTGPRPADRVVRIRDAEGEWIGYRAASVRLSPAGGEPASLLALWGPHAAAAPVTAADLPPGPVGETTLFDGAPLGAALVSREGRLLRANARLAGLMGWTGGRAPEGSLVDLLPPDLRRRAAAALRSAASGRADAVHGEVEAAHAQGHRLPLGLHLSAPSGPEGALLLLVEDRSAYRATQDRVRQAERIASLGRLAGGIAHDFNNLMTVVTGHAELVLEDLPPDSAAARDVREIRSAGLRAASLTDELLTFSRRRRGEPVQIDLGRLLRELEPDLREWAGAEVELLLDVAPGTDPVEVDPSQLRRLLEALVSNARAAMPRGGRLALSVRNREAAQVALAVTDTGEGMPADVVSHIFEPFFSTRPQGEGTGLGLALVHGIVEERGGRIEVRSAPGEGTTMTILLPAVTAPGDAASSAWTAPRAPRPSPQGPAPLGTGQRRVPRPLPELPTSPWTPAVPRDSTLLPADVLLVEDEESVRRLGARILEREGFRVRTASTGAEAVTRLTGGAGVPDLILADTRLRDLDVATFVAAVRTVSPSVPVLLLSAMDPRDDRVPRGPGLSVLQKPFNAEDLAAAARKALRGARGG